MIFWQTFGYFVLGMLVTNAGEWLMHKYILHGLGKHKHSIWAYHWHEHHAVCFQHQMLDPGYQQINFSTWNTQTKEIVTLLLILLSQLPLIDMAFWYVAGFYCSIALYYYKHRKAHLDPEWAKRHLPWHYEHHLGPSSDANWCVTWPWFDYLMGTRKK